MSTAPKHFEVASRPDGARLAAARSKRSPVVSSLFQFFAMANISFGCPISEILPGELQRRGHSRVFVVTNKSLSGTPTIAAVIAALGNRLAGVYDRVVAHAPRTSVIDGTIAARASEADILLAVGGDSVIDAAKAMLLALRHGYTKASQLDAHANAGLDAAYMTAEESAKWLRLVALPTTLSATEYTPFASITEPMSKAQQAFNSAMMTPLMVINDPDMIRDTPLRLILSTGMKAVDHAVERITSVRATPYCDAVSVLGLNMLSRNLRQLAGGDNSADVRSKLQYGVWMTMAGGAEGVFPNLSHAIAHALGSTCDVPHGETSCVLLPSVLRWLGPAIDDRRRLLCHAMDHAGDEPAEAVAELVKALRLPGRLRDVGVKTEDLDRIANRALHDRLMPYSRRKITDVAQVREILDLAW